MKNTALLAFCAFMSFCVSSTAMAGTAPKLVSSNQDWNVYTFDDGGKKVCFMSSQPFSKEGDYTKRGEVFMFVTRWSDKQDSSVVSISNGYTFKKDSKVSVKVAGKTYEMFTQDEMAWTKDSATDKDMTASLKRGSDVVVEGVSKFGTKTKDTYSLKGSSDAYLAMVNACK